MLVEPWRITLFGGLKAEQSHQVVTRFRTRKAASLLAFLACFPHRSHAREEIVERFWPDDLPEAGRAKLRLALTSLRHQLEPPGTQAGTVLFADRAFLRLNAHAAETDVAAFEADLRAAQQATDPAAKADLLARAVERCEGDFLPGDYEEWALQERERLKACCLTALDQLASILPALNRAEEAAAYARRLLAADPYREDAHVRLMRLYLQLNRPADAVRQYQDLQQIMREAFDAAPGDEAQALAATLTASGSVFGSAPLVSPPVSCVHAELPASSAPLAAFVSYETESADIAAMRLPVFFTRCFGREKDIRLLAEILRPGDLHDEVSQADDGEPTRLVTLMGTGGAGKTRLAVETARYVQQRTSCPVVFVGLADVTDAVHIPRAIADALCLPRQESGDDLGRITHCLREIPALLVLDNFEQLLPEGAAFVQQLLTRLPQARCLITSRQHLGLPGERAFPAQPLQGAFSQQLFVDRAQAVRADFQITPRNAASIAELCDRLEGIPLAIELCAVWAGTLTPAQMLSRLNQRFDLLIDRRDDRAVRHRALRAAIAWSCDLLPPDLQMFFARLSVFRGGWTAEAAQTVCGQPAALHLLAQLRERSLVVSEETEDGSAMRFRMLESLREFAAERLEERLKDRLKEGSEEEEGETLRRAHADCFMNFAETADREFNGPEQAFWFTRLEQEHNNIRAALAWQASRPDALEQELRLASAMQVFWWTRGYIREGRERLNAAMTRPGMEAFPKAQRRALAAAGILANMQGDYAVGRKYHERALQLARDMEDWAGVAISLGSLGNIAKNTGDYPSARQLYRECFETAERIEQKSICATAIGNLGNVAKETGDYKEALKLYEQCLALHRANGNKQGTAVVLSNLAGLKGETGDAAGALPVLVECLELCRELGDKEGIAFALETFAQIASESGQWPRSARLYAAADGLRERIGTPLSTPDKAALLQNLAKLRDRLGAPAFDACWKAEDADSLEQSIAFALEAVRHAPPQSRQKMA